jgi:dTMP kinase
MQGEPARGRFITFEGGEGAGKSTQVRRLRDALEGIGVKAILTREPGGSPKAEEIRRLLLGGTVKPFGHGAEAMMFSAARIDHLDTLIRPALAEGAWVICDRFADSTRAYQGTLGAIEPRLIDALERVAVGPTRPDLTFILDIAPEEGLRRGRARAGAGSAADRFEQETLLFHRAVRNAFLDIAAREPVRCAVIDAALDADTIAARVWSTVQVRLLSTGMPPHRGRRKPQPQALRL